MKQNKKTDQLSYMNTMKKYTQVKSLLLVLLLLLCGGFILNFLIQLFSFKLEFGATWEWVYKHIGLYVCGSLFFFFMLLGFAAMIPNIYISTVVMSFIVLTIGFANYKKQSTTGEPLYPWDFMQLKNVKEMTTITQGMISPIAVGVTIVVLGVIGYAIYKLPKISIRISLRAVTLVIATSLIGSFIWVVSARPEAIASLKYNNIFWNQKVNYSQNGFLFAFTGNLKHNLMEKPTGYSKETIEAIAKKYSDLPEPSSLTSTSNSLPMEANIVYIMNEAFFDPTRLESLEFSEDPLKFIHGAYPNKRTGYLLSPEFGGNTANVEFEALTGLSMNFLNGGSIPYQQRLVKMNAFPSIVSILKERGYGALAIHPFDKTFYQRNKVYPMLGFDEFISETEMKNNDRITPNGYISDMAAMKEVLQELHSVSKPTFIHLVTMQNHFPFTKGLNGDNSITVKGMDSKFKDEIETYVHSSALTDEAMSYLAKELQEIDRPTLVVFWGDHLPALSNDIYVQAGWDNKVRLKHETTLMYIANFDIGEEEIGTLSPAFLGPTVFNLAQQPLPTYYKLLEMVRSEISGLSNNVMISSNGGEITQLTDDQEELLQDYKMIQYDILEGENYATELLFK
jgi:phosphoglycerol transferase MdoB-like AlkP superfamily enzyme